MTTEYADALPQGSRIEGYEIVRVLGVGGFGMTYLGFDDDLDIAVAIKEYLPDALARRDSSLTVTPRSTDDAADFQWGLDRFLSEARDLARFNHPNIIRVRRYFRAHGTAYIVMDYAEGETLSDLIKREGKLSQERVQGILLPLMDGLDDVHRSDLLHRDIKPGNIIIRENGQPVLIDFGAARQSTGARSRSMTAVLTPGYAPLEQYSTKGNQGAWTDIYALAAVAYRALTGITPEEATNRVVEDDLLPAVEAGKSYADKAFLKAIDWGLAMNGDERPRDIAAFRAALGGEAPAITRTPQTKPSQPAGGKINIKDKRIVITIGAIWLLGIMPLLFYLGQFYLGQKTQPDIQSTQTQPDIQSTQTQPDLQGTQLVTAIQTELDRLDYVLEADGVFGAGTCARITAYQKAHDLSVNCTPSMELLDHLRQASAPEGLKETKRRAQWGDAKHQNRLGVLYRSGNGVAKDYAKALEWFRKAADQGDAWGQFWLGWMYYGGDGVAKNLSIACDLWRNSAAQNNANAKELLKIIKHCS